MFLRIWFGQLCSVFHAVPDALLREFPDGNSITSGAKRLRFGFSTFQRQCRALRWHDQVSRECEFVTLCLW